MKYSSTYSFSTDRNQNMFSIIKRGQAPHIRPWAGDRQRNWDGEFLPKNYKHCTETDVLICVKMFTYTLQPSYS